MATETIGFPLSLEDGVFDNVEIVDGKLYLKKLGTTSDGRTSYASQGVWTSNAIDLGGKYTTLENLAITKVLQTDTSFKAFTSTSDDGDVWDDFAEINYDTGKMMSIPRRFVKVKVELFGNEPVDNVEVFEDFTDPSRFEDNDYISFDNGLGLKKNYNLKMNNDSSWNDEGTLFRKTIKRSEFRRIDSLRF